MLQVQDDGLEVLGGELGLRLGVADDADDGVAPCAQQTGEASGYPPVDSRDHDPHVGGPYSDVVRQPRAATASATGVSSR